MAAIGPAAIMFNPRLRGGVCVQHASLKSVATLKAKGEMIERQ
jgi:hypothetical protein